MKLKTYILFLSTIFIFEFSNLSGQEFVQICSEPTTISECEFSSQNPNYKTPYYSYVIARDTFATNVVRTGKQVTDFSEGARLDLLMDVYMPCNNETSRPLVLVPQANGYSSDFGKVQLSDTANHRYFMSELARRG